MRALFQFSSLQFSDSQINQHAVKREITRDHVYGKSTVARHRYVQPEFEQRHSRWLVICTMHLSTMDVTIDRYYG